MTKTTEVKPGRPAWRDAVAAFERPNHGRSAWQLVNSVLPYFALLAAMYFALDVSYWLAFALAVPAAGFLTRIFIIFHDCGHGSFFKSKTANRIVGFFTGLLTFIPSYYWHREHAEHHASAGDLDDRGSGDIWTLTVREYVESSRWRRLQYRLYRNPFVLFVLGPAYTFLVRYRFWRRRDNRRARWSTVTTNLALVAVAAIMGLTIGLKAYMLIQIPVLIIAATVGVWLFYVQHQFEETYWERRERWSYAAQAFEGSSYYELPGLLRWFTGNIGFHHIHHLSPRIPNYNLKDCHEGNPIFAKVRHITLKASLKSLKCRLWDEEKRRLVGFGEIEALLVERASRALRRTYPNLPVT
jgi:omega-6 fatty acid desaturase (delta-12 desaturase)